MGSLIERKKKIMMMQMQGGGLPAEYQQVEYLESSGTQYIQINNRFDTDIYYTLVCQSYDISTTQVILAHSAKGGYWFGTANGYYAVNTNVTRVRSSEKITVDIVYFESSMRARFENGAVYSGMGYNSDPRGLTIFGAQGTSSWFYSSVKIFSLKADGVIDLIPCIRKSDDKPGMYDTVSKTFFTNAGTGEFIVPQ